MEANEATFSKLSELFTQTLSADTQILRQVQETLGEASTQPGFGPVVLQFMLMPSVPVHCRQSAAVYFKNFVKKQWAEDPSVSGGFGAGAPSALPEQDRAVIRDNLVEAIFSSPASIRAQLTESVSQIAVHDFPQKWESLLPSLLQRLQTQDFHVIVGVLHVMHSVFKRYPGQFRSDELFTEIKYCVDTVGDPLVKLYVATSQYAEQVQGDPKALVVVLEALNLLTRNIYALTYCDLPEYFEDHIAEWMPICHKWLQYKNKAIQDDEDDEADIVTKLHTSICKVFALFIEKYDEEFQSYLQPSIELVWATLMATGAQSKYDQLVTAALGILTVTANGIHHAIFTGDGVLQQLADKVLIPNVQCREADVELFEDNPMEYIRQHIEGSDSDTRRRAAADLVRALCAKYNDQVTAIFTAAISAMLTQYKANPAQNWPMKDAAIYLVIALTATTTTQRDGATSTNALVPLNQFFEEHLAAEITTKTPPSQILQADALKYMSVFRKQLPKQYFVQVLPNVVEMLSSPSIVLHSYASHFVERLLLLKVDGQRVITDDDLKPHMGSMLTSLFNLIANFQENDYVMRAVMRVITSAHQQVVPHTEICLTKLTEILLRVAKNPTNPGFSHYLFETIAALVKLVTQANPASVEQFKSMLFPPFQQILQNEVVEFKPYVFQILAQLLEKTTGEIGAGFQAIFPSILVPALWSSPGNAPPLVRMLSAYTKKAPQLFAQSLMGVLGVFQKLISRSDTDVYAFELLTSIVKNVPLESYKGHLTGVFNVIFQRLQSIGASKFAFRYAKSMIIWMSEVVLKFGPDFLVEAIDSIQPKLFFNIFQSKWLTTTPRVVDPQERKILAAAMIKLALESNTMRNENYQALWGRLVHATVVVMQSPSARAGGVESDDEHDGAEEALEASQGYQATYSRLYHATRPVEADPMAGVDCVAVLKTGLSTIGKSAPNLLQLLSALNADEQAVITSVIGALG